MFLKTFSSSFLLGMLNLINSYFRNICSLISETLNRLENVAKSIDSFVSDMVKVTEIFYDSLSSLIRSEQVRKIAMFSMILSSLPNDVTSTTVEHESEIYNFAGRVFITKLDDQPLVFIFKPKAIKCTAVKVEFNWDKVHLYAYNRDKEVEHVKCLIPVNISDVHELKPDTLTLILNFLINSNVIAKTASNIINVVRDEVLNF